MKIKESPSKKMTKSTNFPLVVKKCYFKQKFLIIIKFSNYFLFKIYFR